VFGIDHAEFVSQFRARLEQLAGGAPRAALLAAEPAATRAVAAAR
jgi:hypothetical protein